MVNILLQRVTTTQIKSKNILRGILVINALLYTAWTIAHFQEIYNTVAAVANSGWAIELNLKFWLRDLKITCALLIATITLLSNRVYAILVSMLALISVLIQYLSWYSFTINLKIIAEPNNNYLQQHIMFGFYNANLWHIWILLLTLIIIGGQVVVLCKIDSHQDNKPLK